jgi:monoamine oxidase
MTDTDVVVVGAGAAGLAAATRLQAAGVPFVLIEAKHRAGGRAFTDIASFGVPFDHGCHWLHSASLNPFVAIADRLGVRYERHAIARRRLFLAGREADEVTRDAASQAVADAFAATASAGSAGQDVAMSDVVDGGAPWNRIVTHWTGLMSSVAPADLSTLDFSRYRDTVENWAVVDGFGSLVVANAANVPVTLGVRATAIDWSGSGVMVDTDAGAIRSRAAIVTVSTTVLGRGGIRFTPALPADLQEAFSACALGHAEKIAFRFDRPLGDVPPTASVVTIEPQEADRLPINFIVNEFGRPLAVGYIGGDFAEEIGRAGAAAMIDFARAALVDAFGSSVVKRIVAAKTTAWSADRDIGGAYSNALPGRGALRDRLPVPVGDRIRFAGEAVAGEFFSTAHGAHLSGLAAADWAIGRAEL